MPQQPWEVELAKACRLFRRLNILRGAVPLVVIVMGVGALLLMMLFSAVMGVFR
jgi:hypothetical protein